MEWGLCKRRVGARVHVCPRLEGGGTAVVGEGLWGKKGEGGGWGGGVGLSPRGPSTLGHGDLMITTDLQYERASVHVWRVYRRHRYVGIRPAAACNTD